MFRGIPDEGPIRVAPKVLYTDGPLGGGLAGAQDDRALAADEFMAAMNGGITAIGEGLMRIADHVTDIDLGGRDAITRLFSGSR